MVATASDSRERGRIVAVRERAQGIRAEGVIVELGGSRPGRTLDLETAVDVPGARRLRRTVKRVSLVTMSVGEDGDVSAVADGVGHRLPFRRRVTASTALGLALLGVPTLVSYSPEAQS